MGSPNLAGWPETGQDVDGLPREALAAQGDEGGPGGRALDEADALQLAVVANAVLGSDLKDVLGLGEGTDDGRRPHGAHEPPAFLEADAGLVAQAVEGIGGQGNKPRTRDGGDLVGAGRRRT